MGGRGSKSSTSAIGTRNSISGVSEPAQAPIGKKVTGQDVRDHVSKLDPQRFTHYGGEAPPDIITINGVEFKWWGNVTEIVTSTGKEYSTWYQSRVQASNGEWPIFKVVVEAKQRRGRATKYSYKMTPGSGTGFL